MGGPPPHGAGRRPGASRPTPAHTPPPKLLCTRVLARAVWPLCRLELACYGAGYGSACPLRGKRCNRGGDIMRTLYLRARWFCNLASSRYHSAGSAWRLARLYSRCGLPLPARRRTLPF